MGARLRSEPASWGRVVRAEHRYTALSSRHDALPVHGADPATLLPYGNGRSYGDSNLNPGGVLLDARPLDRFIAFDTARGVLRCEAGVLLDDVLALAVPHGWFPAVTPGTRYVTVGGAIANDVHGKNHHRAGSFGHHVLRLELLRSDGTRRVCAPDGENADWFAATVGGLGLTGLVTWAELQLQRIDGPAIDVETLRFRSLDEFHALSRASAADWDYTVAWIDCAASGAQFGRGLFSRGNHAAGAVRERGTARRVPFTPPCSPFNALTLKAFNAAYFRRQRADRVRALQHYRPFFYPLDALLDWNRLYGPRGFYQYQCVVPEATIAPLLQAVAASGLGSFLAVLKQFGERPSHGLLSFPRPGTTLALDFPNRGARLHALFERLDALVLDAGGRLYPAKDGRMGAAMFQAGYPRWREFATYVDPCFSSAFWRRVSLCDAS